MVRVLYDVVQGATHTDCDLNARFGQNIKRWFRNETGTT